MSQIAFPLALFLIGLIIWGLTVLVRRVAARDMRATEARRVELRRTAEQERVRWAEERAAIERVERTGQLRHTYLVRLDGSSVATGTLARLPLSHPTVRHLFSPERHERIHGSIPLPAIHDLLADATGTLSRDETGDGELRAAIHAVIELQHADGRKARDEAARRRREEEARRARADEARRERLTQGRDHYVDYVQGMYGPYPPEPDDPRRYAGYD